MVSHPVPGTEPDQILVRSAAVGICGSDLSALKGTRPSAFIHYPLIPGHEWSGTVVAVGGTVTGWTVGDRAAVAGLRACGICIRCSQGERNLCEAGYAEIGFTEPGGLAQYVAVPAGQLVRIPDSLSSVDAALLEPTAVVALAMASAGDLDARTVAVVGDGALGQIAAQLCRLAGAAHVTVFGTGADRLGVAAELGADATFLVTAGDPNRGYRRDVAARGADVVIETGGSVSAVELALSLTRRGGRAVLTGVAGDDAFLTLASDMFVVSSLTVSGVVGSTAASWQRALSWAASGRLRLTPLVSHRFPLSEVARAFTVAADRAPGTLKVIITHDSQRVVRPDLARGTASDNEPRRAQG